MKKLFCSQPKLLIVIELKLAEILGVCGIVAILYGFGCIMTYVLGIDRAMTNPVVMICKGVIFVGGLFVLFGIYHAIKANWAWAGRIAKK
jgi:hypothetical protein